MVSGEPVVGLGLSGHTSDRGHACKLHVNPPFQTYNPPTHLANRINMDIESCRLSVGEAFFIRSVGSRHYTGARLVG